MIRYSPEELASMEHDRRQGKKIVGELVQGDKVTPIYEGQEKIEYNYLPGQQVSIRRFEPQTIEYQTATGLTPSTVVDERTYRKQRPVFSGVLRYFPDALLEVAYTSFVGNEQHNPDEPLHWAKEKSTDEADALVRHLLDAGTRDTDGVRHSAKVAWRSLALLQREIEAERDAKQD